MTGKFIVVEGLEGAGKSSVIALVESIIQTQGHKTITTREPGGTPMAEAIRHCVKQNWQETVTEETELMLMYAARAQLLANVIKPALADGKWVIGDRHDLSSQAYQGGGRGIQQAKLDALRDITLQGFVPDLTLYLDVEPEVGLARARGRGELDRIELAGLDFFHRTRARYQALAAADESVITIDAMQHMEAVHQSVKDTLEHYFSC
ncbi:dTMP kinase [Alteromonas gilva]|uniref:Thymidylate kinase n=1 Tax=Alteromonas gilva TaxID=2987522 RepID=A0ABT5L4A3_9ALTE|nr:dTMP kinase [Alteromonas gilva]MDC8831264.1 dTMP kinase [Alteromonas gilva]